jgi:hypothetical protein
VVDDDVVRLKKRNFRFHCGWDRVAVILNFLLFCSLVIFVRKCLLLLIYFDCVKSIILWFSRAALCCPEVVESRSR